MSSHFLARLPVLLSVTGALGLREKKMFVVLPKKKEVGRWRWVAQRAKKYKYMIQHWVVFIWSFDVNKYRRVIEVFLLWYEISNLTDLSETVKINWIKKKKQEHYSLKKTKLEKWRSSCASCKQLLDYICLVHSWVE